MTTVDTVKNLGVKPNTWRSESDDSDFSDEGRDKVMPVVPDESDDFINLKSLASLSRIGHATTVDKRTGRKSDGAHPLVDPKVIRDISLKSEVIAAIIRRTVDDVLGNGYRFDLAEGIERGEPRGIG